MVHSPSHRWIDGKLVERAIDAPSGGDPDQDQPIEAKQVTAAEVEDKAVKKPATRTKKAAKK